MTDILVDLFTEASSEEVAVICYLLTGRVAPMFVPIEFNVAEKTIARVLEQYCRSLNSRSDIARLYEETGDLGEVARIVLDQSKKKRSGKTVMEVYSALWSIAGAAGTGSTVIRDKRIYELLNAVSPHEALYVIRIVLQKLRLGSSSKTVLDALSTLKMGNKDDRDVIERAFGVCPDLGYVAQVYCSKGRSGVEKIRVVPGVPILSMLVEREKDVASVAKRIPRSIVQPKYDGLRCQIHVGVDTTKALEGRVWMPFWLKEKDEAALSLFGMSHPPKSTRLFSRNLEDMTDMFPEIVIAAERLPVDSAVLDSEIVGFDDKTRTFVPFQETMTRKRKYDVVAAAAGVPVKAFVFDVLYADGKELIGEENTHRIDMLKNIVKKSRLIEVAGSPLVDSANDLQKLFDDNISLGLEGVIVKDPKSVYQPGKRGFDWIKLKKAFQGHLADTVDVVIMGYYFGRGKQAVFGMGALLGGVYNRSRDTFETLTKIGTGITEDQWKMIAADLRKYKVRERPLKYVVEKRMYPNVWIAPAVVATIEADEITKSPVHTAGRRGAGISKDIMRTRCMAGTGGTLGYALRFPRLKVWKRDRLPEDATTVKEIEEMYGIGKR